MSTCGDPVPGRRPDGLYEIGVELSLCREGFSWLFGRVENLVTINQLFLSCMFTFDQDGSPGDLKPLILDLETD